LNPCRIASRQLVMTLGLIVRFHAPEAGRVPNSNDLYVNHLNLRRSNPETQVERTVNNTRLPATDTALIHALSHDSPSRATIDSSGAGDPDLRIDRFNHSA